MANPAHNPLEGIDVKAASILRQMVLLAVAFVANNFVEKRQIPIPPAIVTIAIGAIFGAAGLSDINGFEDTAALNFMLVFAAPIIFAEGYGMKSRSFFSNIGRILTHAFLGTGVSTVIVAFAVFYLPKATGLALDLQLTLAESLAFGAMISATDPVTTLVVFKEQGLVEKGVGHLYYSVSGESILNDAVGVTLFQSFGKLIPDNEEITPGTLLEILGTFGYSFICSSIIGCLFGAGTALILKLSHLDSEADENGEFSFNVPELGLVLIMSYTPFLAAECIDDLSGFVAVLFAGITMRHYAHYNMTKTTRSVFLPSIELIAVCFETYLFLALGIGVHMLQSQSFSVVFISWTFLACLVGRAAHVYPFSFAVNVLCSCSSQKKLSMNEQHVVWFAGLRGAVAFMCALGFPMRSEGEDPESRRSLVIFTTTIIVGVTMVLFGWPTGVLLRFLKIVPEAEPEAELAARMSTTEPSRTGFLHDCDRRVMQVVMTSDALKERDETFVATRPSNPSFPMALARQPSPRVSFAKPSSRMF
eukprot:TRINITY_DN18036_c0_g1_i1.p1 TRINITY_DN18036_c0_g1~~TRINITY_DN18036_c0_g1_i1.p1  ORF type:complete len:554 (+),score=64.65 TRINITY_DN18036_c0_g1_i1:67-1662(+)